MIIIIIIIIIYLYTYRASPPEAEESARRPPQGSPKAPPSGPPGFPQVTPGPPKYIYSYLYMSTQLRCVRFASELKRGGGMREAFRYTQHL